MIQSSAGSRRRGIKRKRTGRDESVLSLFDLASTQTSVTNVYNDEIRPMSQTPGDSPFEFRISGQSSMDYLDLKNSQIYVNFKLEKLDGTSTGELTVDKVGPANLFLQALFSTVKVTLQNKATFTCNYNPYRAYIQTIKNYGSDAATSQLTSQFFAMDTAKIPKGFNPGLFERATLTVSSKSVDLQGPIFHDIFSMSKCLINQVDVKIKLYRSSNNFCIVAGDATEYRVSVEDICILARKIRVNPAVIYGHSKILENQNALYPDDKVEVKSVSIATGSTTYSWDSMFQGRRPNKLIIGFVKSKAVSGDYKTNPFCFENCSIQQIAVYCDGLPVGGNPLKLNFDLTKGASFIRAYDNLLLSNGKWRHDEGNQLSREHFECGSALFVFKIEPDFSHHGEYLSLVTPLS
ncbi:YMD2-like protein, partial [Mya arenaria]